MSKFTGNIIRLPAVTPTQNSASGVYTLDDQFTAQSSGTWPIVRDQYFNYTTLLLTGAVQGTAYPNPVTQPYSFLSDASTNNFVVSPNGDVSARPFNPYLNSYGNYFNGSSYLSAANNAAFNLSNGNFTLECWFYIAGNSASNPSSERSGQLISKFQNSSNYYTLYVLGNSTTTGTALRFEIVIAGSAQTIQYTTSIAQNQWHHVAVVRNGSSTNNVTIYLNGSSVASGTNTATEANTGPLYIGYYGYPSYDNYFNGYISNARFVKGTAVYTAPFIPPTQPLQNISGTSLLTCQANRFIDLGTANSGSGFTITPSGSPAVSQNSPFVSYDTTNGSGYFDGNGDWLASSSATAIGTSSFTFETWAYMTNTSGTRYVYNSKNAGSNGVGILYTASSSQIILARYGTANDLTASYTFPANEWVHIVVTRSGTGANQTAIFANGSRLNVGQVTTSYTANGFEVGGESASASNSIAGYLSNTRLVIGSSVYDPSLTTLTNTLTGATGVPTAPLPVVSGTSLLTLQTRAPATNNGFIDSSPNNFVVTRNGNTTQGSFSPFSPTGWGNYISGTNYMYLGGQSSFAFGSSNDWAIEVFFYATSVVDITIVDFRPSSTQGAYPTIYIANSNIYYYTSSANRITSDSNISANVWYHLVVSRVSGTTRMFINGVAQTQTFADTTNYLVGANRPTLGVGGFNLLSPLNGYLSNLRILNGSGFSSVTVPTAPLTAIANTVLLTCQSNRFKDNSPNNFTLTVNGSPSVQAFSPFAPAQSYIPSQIGGSGYFDGTTDYLGIADNTALELGAGDFTIESWVYLTALPSSTFGQAFIAKWNASNYSYLAGTFNNSGTMQLAFNYTTNGSTAVVTRVNASITTGNWFHTAYVRSGGSLKIFLNGTEVTSSATISGTLYDGTEAVNVGRSGDNANYVTGYLSGTRIVKGTALYTANFTPPTTPPTAIPNTSLLLNFTNGGIVDATGKNNLETVANSGVQTSVIKYGNGSMYFDGGTDCLFESSSTNYGYGSGDFTIEFWLRLNNTGTQTIVSNLTTASSVAPHIYYQVSSNIRYFTNGADRITGSALNANQWYHIAVCRFSSNTKMFVDGSQVGSTYPDTNNYGASNPLGVGDYGVPLSGVSTLNGYISNLRITKYARYTTNFNTNLPPGPFPLG